MFPFIGDVRFHGIGGAVVETGAWLTGLRRGGTVHGYVPCGIDFE
jgi:hypothetical protein